MKYIKTSFLLIIFTLIYNSDICAQYVIENGVFGNGGSVYSNNYTINGTVGQAITGTINSKENISDAGFWYYFVGEQSPVDVEESKSPGEFRLKGNYPNPFNPSTTISFEVPTENQVKITIYSLNGQVIDTLVNESLKEGSHSVKWQPEGLAGGVYFYSIESGTKKYSGKMLLLK